MTCREKTFVAGHGPDNIQDFAQKIRRGKEWTMNGKMKKGSGISKR